MGVGRTALELTDAVSPAVASTATSSRTSARAFSQRIAACGEELAFTGPGAFSNHADWEPRAEAASASVNLSSLRSRAFSRLRLSISSVLSGMGHILSDAAN